MRDFRWLVQALILTSFPLAAGAADSKSGAADLGRKVFTKLAQPSCTVCHALEDAGAKSTIGPSLDELKPDAQRVVKAVQKGVGVMPPYEGMLTPEQIKAVAAYVAGATRGK